MSESGGVVDGPSVDTRTVAELLEGLTWEDLTSDGYTTTDEIDARLRAEGYDPNQYDYLYE